MGEFNVADPAHYQASKPDTPELTDGEWLARYVHVHSNFIKALDADRMRRIAEKIIDAEGRDADRRFE